MSSFFKSNDKQLCTGCRACEHSCPVDAIKMREDEEGFLYPEVKSSICINCGLCEKRCPMVKFNFVNRPKKSYAAINNDNKVVIKSSSGGVFSALADEILKYNGVVCGATLNDENEVNHIIISNTKDLFKLRGSKYVQSNLNKVFIELKELLDKNITVLFSGTPCQVAGLKSFLVKDYNNLITIDLICHGVPSPKFFKEYIKYLENKFNCKVNDYKFRDKESNMIGPVESFIKIKGSKEKRIYRMSYQSPYSTGFLGDILNRPVCYKCIFSNRSRVADITIGDYWGVERYHSDIDVNRGISALIVNTCKGESIINDIKDKLTLKETNIENIACDNLNLIKATTEPEKRADFYKDFINKENFKFIIKTYLTPRHKIFKVILYKIPKPIKRTLKLILNK